MFFLLPSLRGGKAQPLRLPAHLIRARDDYLLIPDGYLRLYCCYLRVQSLPAKVDKLTELLFEVQPFGIDGVTPGKLHDPLVIGAIDLYLKLNR